MSVKEGAVAQTIPVLGWPKQTEFGDGRLAHRIPFISHAFMCSFLFFKKKNHRCIIHQ